VGVFASAAGLLRRSAPVWGGAGLALAVPFAALVAVGEPVGTALVAIPALAIGFAVAQWR
jgi:hypothetical protein